MGKNFWQHPGHLIWILLAYVPLLGALSLPITGDQKTYISVAMEMRQRGGWLTPYLFGEPNYLKPPFQYWVTLLGWKVFGFSLFGALIPSVIALLLTAWFISEISQFLGERRWYVSSGLWFAITFGAVTYADVAQMEIHTCLFYAAAWWAGLKFLQGDNEKRNFKWLYAAFLIAGFSSLVKSPLYAVFWVVSFLIYCLISGEWLIFKNKHLYFAWLAGMGLGGLWFVYAFISDPDMFWNQYWIQEQVQKQNGNGSSFKDVWVPLLYLAFPCTLLLFTAIRSVMIGRRTSGVMRWVIAWALPPAVFFSFYPYRVSTYLFILIPAIAVLVDWGCFRSNRTRTFLWMSRSTGIVLGIGLPLFALTLARLELSPLWLVLALAFAGVAAVIVTWSGWMRLFVMVSLVVVLLVRIGVAEISKRDLNGLRDALGSTISKDQGAMIDEDRDVWHEVGMLSAALGVEMKRLDGVDEAVDHLTSGGLLILTDLDVEKYFQTLQDFLKEKGMQLESHSWKRFKRRQKLPIFDLVFYGKSSVPDFEDRMTRTYQVVKAVICPSTGCPSI